MFCSLFFAFLFFNLLYSLEAKYNFFLPFFFLTYISSFHSCCLFRSFPFILFLLSFLFLPYYFFFFSTFLSLFFPLYLLCFLSSLSFILSLSFLLFPFFLSTSFILQLIRPFPPLINQSSNLYP